MPSFIKNIYEKQPNERWLTGEKEETETLFTSLIFSQFKDNALLSHKHVNTVRYTQHSTYIIDVLNNFNRGKFKRF